MIFLFFFIREVASLRTDFRYANASASSDSSSGSSTSGSWKAAFCLSQDDDSSELEADSCQLACILLDLSWFVDYINIMKHLPIFANVFIGQFYEFKLNKRLQILITRNYNKKEENMIDRNLQKLKYETSVHHKQNLRSAIDQNMIDRLEISPHPSLNYQKAYQSLYQDELQKSVMLLDQKKAVDQTKKVYDTLVAGQHVKIYKDEEPFKDSISAVNVPNLNYRDVRYLDYDLLKETKALDHTLKNYDGGQSFFKNCDQHQQRQREELEKMRATLQKQISMKQFQKNKEWEKKREEEFAIKNREQYEKNYQSQVMQTQMNERQKHRDAIMDQMQEERVKRGRRSIFNYNNISRHNPITNPIEYHIDNPYILRQIQGTTSSQSFHSGNMYGR